MRKRFARLPDQTRVFRNIRVGGGFLPPGHRLPKPEWLEPNSDDIAAAARSGRPAGLSVWDEALATHRDACWWRDVAPRDCRSFAASVGAITQIGAAHERPLVVVADPLETSHEPRLEALSREERKRLEEAAQGHSLIEGIRRPPESPKRAHKEFRLRLSEMFEPI